MRNSILVTRFCTLSRDFTRLVQLRLHCTVLPHSHSNFRAPSKGQVANQTHTCTHTYTHSDKTHTKQSCVLSERERKEKIGACIASSCCVSRRKECRRSRTRMASNSGVNKKSDGSPVSSEFEFIEGAAKMQQQPQQQQQQQEPAKPPRGMPPPAQLPPPPQPITSPIPNVAPPVLPPSVAGPPAQLPAPPSPPAAILTTTADQQQQQQRQQQSSVSSPAQSDSGGSGLIFGWTSGIISKVAEKTRSSVETMITTLDPQMKEYIYSGGDVEVWVASDKESKVCSVRDAFQRVFGRATVTGLAAHPSVTVAEQPVGFAAGKQGALERAQALRARNKDKVRDADVIVAVEGFILEVGDDCWVEQSCLLLSDPAKKIQLTCYSQPTNVDARFVQMAKESTPDNYPKRWSGLNATVGSLMAKEWIGVEGPNWQEAVTGVSRQRTLDLAAEALAGMYQRELILFQKKASNN